MEPFSVGSVLNFDNRKTFFGMVIGKFTDSKFTHSGIVYNYSINHVWVAEAVSRGFKVNKYSRKELTKRLNNKTLQSRSSVVKLVDVRKHCNKYFGIKYGYFTLLQIAIMIAIGKRYTSDGIKTLICSEGVSRVFYDASCHLVDISKEFECRFDYVTPKMLSESTQLETWIR